MIYSRCRTHTNLQSPSKPQQLFAQQCSSSRLPKHYLLNTLYKKQQPAIMPMHWDWVHSKPQTLSRVTPTPNCNAATAAALTPPHTTHTEQAAPTYHCCPETTAAAHKDLGLGPVLIGPQSSSSSPSRPPRRQSPPPSANTNTMLISLPCLAAAFMAVLCSSAPQQAQKPPAAAAASTNALLLPLTCLAAAVSGRPAKARHHHHHHTGSSSNNSAPLPCTALYVESYQHSQSSRQSLAAVLSSWPRHHHESLSQLQQRPQIQPPSPLHSKRQQSVKVKGGIRQQQPPVLNEYCCC